MSKSKPIRVLIIGLGNMGKSHALSYHKNDGFKIVGLINRSHIKLPQEISNYPRFECFEESLYKLKPDLVSICTYTDTHAKYAIKAMKAGAHIFVEKPIATTYKQAKKVVKCAKKLNRKLIVGYILRHHPSWVRLIDEAKKLGGPYVFRLNLNQQSSANEWKIHKKLMQTTPPIVDCGVHYIDVMCQITRSKPVKVNAMGLRLTYEVSKDMYNYGHFQVSFKDGSVGWYEAGWGPMMSEEAFFVKDIISPNGCVSIKIDNEAKSADIDTHTKTSKINIHHSMLNDKGEFARADELISMEGEPDHQQLCDNEQEFVLRAIRDDLNLEEHMYDAVQSLRICLAADKSVRTGKSIRFNTK